MASITISLVLDSERDADLLRWLESEAGSSRSALIRETLRRGLDRSGSTLDEIRQVIREELAGYARGSSAVTGQTSEPSRAAANLDGLEQRLKRWE